MKLLEIFYDSLKFKGSAYSSKRICGIVSLIFTIVFGFLSYIQPMMIMSGLVIAFFSLTSIDTSTLNAKPPATE